MPPAPARNDGHPYQDPSLPVDARVADLLARMTLEEKAGLLFHTMLAMHPDGRPVEAGDDALVPSDTTGLLKSKLMSHVNLVGTTGPRQLAEWHNAVQEIAAGTRLGIPVTVSTDPRHSFTANIGASIQAGAFSAWPEPTGLAATRDPELVHRFADIARREYLAVGLRVALHPQIDLATEPRWSRQSGTFGADATLTSELVQAYVRGFQGDTLGPHSVATMVKHFPGGGPQKDGEDPHFPHGKEQVYPGGMRDYHLEPFKAAIAAGASQMMPYYGQPIGTDWEEVGFGFNKGVVTGLLRQRLGFDGIVCTDWGLLTDASIFGELHQARAWGVEHLTVAERAAKALDAGADQFGGEACPETVVELVRTGRVTEERIDASVRRLLREKFVLGLFDRPYVDPDLAEEVVGNSEFRAAGEAAQRRSLTVLVNRDKTLPAGTAGRRPKLYAEGVDARVAAEYGDVVADPADADLAVLRLHTPYEHRDNRFESLFHSGRLDFTDEELEPVLRLLDAVPTVVLLNLERPAIVPEIAERAAALIADYGASDEALLDVAFGRATAEGRLPFEMPRSMAAVEASRPDVPHDTADPVFPYGSGLAI
ncbi:glycoside hydrolase family 3 N-terminal domain-containing protein [Streptomyces sp. CB03238]|uniref:glycoside hydrolase family 3 protein n=1 Tax=Streptomyces sp. CB03238 TaxID=1907777 RepID=UPI000A10BE3A|nr:glycoside hydrolase family 3 N-terminal domain-containing protein [Streptomyces sp. CB03238]ORT57078.1 beta-glucosidase [Streptomyces sp. CB03238]